MPATGDCLQPGSNKARPNIVASIMASIGSNNFRDSTSSTLYALGIRVMLADSYPVVVNALATPVFYFRLFLI